MTVTFSLHQTMSINVPRRDRLLSSWEPCSVCRSLKLLQGIILCKSERGDGYCCSMAHRMGAGVDAVVVCRLYFACAGTCRASSSGRSKRRTTLKSADVRSNETNARLDCSSRLCTTTFAITRSSALGSRKPQTSVDINRDSMRVPM